MEASAVVSAFHPLQTLRLGPKAAQSGQPIYLRFWNSEVWRLLTQMSREVFVHLKHRCAVLPENRA
jgi:hypothetical protein